MALPHLSLTFLLGPWTCLGVSYHRQSQGRRKQANTPAFFQASFLTFSNILWLKAKLKGGECSPILVGKMQQSDMAKNVGTRMGKWCVLPEGCETEGNSSFSGPFVSNKHCSSEFNYDSMKEECQGQS